MKTATCTSSIPVPRGRMFKTPMAGATRAPRRPCNRNGRRKPYREPCPQHRRRVHLAPLGAAPAGTAP